jgi:EAL domain-containing protein (putative c-di-GMP-specific phosphodiesterase class I)
LALAAELRRAIDEGLLEVYYQPKMSVSSRQVVGAEALLRWHHPRHGLLLPDEFIPLAESTGLIHPLTAYVLGSSLRQAAAWRGRGIDLKIAVNISARNLLDDDLHHILTAFRTATDRRSGGPVSREVGTGRDRRPRR